MQRYVLSPQDPLARLSRKQRYYIKDLPRTGGRQNKRPAGRAWIAHAGRGGWSSKIRGCSDAAEHEDAALIVFRLDATMHKLRPGGIQSTKPKCLVISNQARDWQRIKAQQPRSNQRRHVPNQWLDKADEHIATDFLDSLARRPISLVPRKVREFNRWNGIDVGPVNRNRNKTGRKLKYAAISLVTTSRTRYVRASPSASSARARSFRYLSRPSALSPAEKSQIALLTSRVSVMCSTRKYSLSKSMDGINGIGAFRDKSQRVPDDAPRQSTSQKPQTPSLRGRLIARWQSERMELQP